jgi:beta-xylosidase
LAKKISLWAPEVHYLRGTFWLTYSMPGYDGTAKTSGSGLLRSTSGKEEGPYVDVHPESRLGDEIDASLFEDTDGKVYFLWHSGKIALMNKEMTGLAEPSRWVRTTTRDSDPKHHSGLCEKIFGKGSFDHIGYEGVYLIKRNGTYYMSASENIDGRYSCVVASSKNIYGPYSQRYEAIPYAGHQVFFQDEVGGWWSTIFGENEAAPVHQKPAIVPVKFTPEGKLAPDDR